MPVSSCYTAASPCPSSACVSCAETMEECGCDMCASHTWLVIGTSMLWDVLTWNDVAQVRSSKQDQIHNSIVSTLLALMDGLDSRGSVVVIG